mmetsp:Transcript_31682/g.67093  ORF Transcript_31682/g.67093 Transcript_31682/m.67093 type:complete len:114 (+) Transcript_31682:122-463(+)
MVTEVSFSFYQKLTHHIPQRRSHIAYIATNTLIIWCISLSLKYFVLSIIVNAVFLTHIVEVFQTILFKDSSIRLRFSKLPPSSLNYINMIYQQVVLTQTNLLNQYSLCLHLHH